MTGRPSVSMLWVSHLRHAVDAIPYGSCVTHYLQNINVKIARSLGRSPMMNTNVNLNKFQKKIHFHYLDDVTLDWLLKRNPCSV